MSSHEFARKVVDLQTEVIAAIKAVVEPHLVVNERFHGYCRRIFGRPAIMDCAGRVFVRDSFGIKLSGLVLEYMIGLTEEGPIDDIRGNTLIVRSYESLPLNDLVMLLAWAETTCEKA